MPLSLPSTSDMIGNPGLAAAQASAKLFNDAVLNGRKTLAYNALRNIYGDVAGDPQAFATMMQGLNSQANANRTNTLLPGEVQQQGATLANTQARTASTQQQTSQANTLFPLTLQEQQQKVNVGSDLENARSNYTNLTTTYQAAQRLGASLGYDPATHTFQGDPQTALTNAPPEVLKAIGVPPELASQFGAKLKQNPALWEQFLTQLGEQSKSAQEQLLTLSGKTSRAAISSGTPSLTDAEIERRAYLAAHGQQAAAFAGLGRSSYSQADRNAISNRAAEIANGQGTINSGIQVKQSQKFAEGMAQDTPSSPGGMTRSANAVLAHMTLLNEYYQALGNGNTQAVNYIRNRWRQQFGSPLPTQIDAQSNIVAAELERFLTGSRGSAFDREEFRKTMSHVQSPAQLAAVVHTYMGDMVGQLTALRQQARALGREPQWTQHLLPETQRLLQAHDNAGKPKPPPAALRMLQAHPELRPQFAAKYDTTGVAGF